MKSAEEWWNKYHIVNGQSHGLTLMVEAIRDEMCEACADAWEDWYRHGRSNVTTSMTEAVRRGRVAIRRAVGKPHFREGQLVRWQYKHDGIGDWYYGPYNEDNIMNRTATISAVHVKIVDGVPIVQEAEDE